MPVEPLHLSIPPLPFGNISFLFGRPILFVVFGLFFIFYVVVSSVLLYHWSEYGMRNKRVLVVKYLYLIVSVALFGVAGLALSLI